MKIKSRKALKCTASILLVVCLLSCSFSVFADNEIYPGQIEITNTQDEMWLYFMWFVLNAWGYEISIDDLSDFSDEIGYELMELVYDFLDTLPSVSSFTEWTMPWSYYIGNNGWFYGNDSMLEDCQDFVDWLDLTFGLATGQTATINPGGIKVNGITAYRTAYIYVQGRNNPDSSWHRISINSIKNGNGWDVTSSIGIDNVYFIQGTYNLAGYPSGNQVLYVVAPYNPSIGNTVVFYGTEQNYNGGAYNYSKTARNPFNSVNYNYYISKTEGDLRYLTGTEVYDSTTIENALKAEVEIETLPPVIITGGEYPDDIEPGDSIVINGDEVVYQVFEFPDSVNVENLPAVIQPNSIDDPEIDQFYDFIPSFIEEAGDSMNFFKQIIFRMPDEVLYCIYAVLASGVIFGFLRILREH